MSSYTVDELKKRGAKPLTRWLIEVALNRDALTYGEGKARLEQLLDITNIFPTHMGAPAGYLMDKIHEVYPDAPLLNVLLVRQSDRMPGNGAGSFMAARFDETKLLSTDPRKNHPELWKRTFAKAAYQVMSYDQWPEVYDATFGQAYKTDEFSAYANLEAKPEHGDFGSGGESIAHKNLRLWALENAVAVCGMGQPVRSKTEVILKSADRVDVVHYFAEQTVAVEVKSILSNDLDLERGIFQCIKYRAVLEAMDPRPGPNVSAFLVTEQKLPGYLNDLCSIHKIKHFMKK